MFNALYEKLYINFITMNVTNQRELYSGEYSKFNVLYNWITCTVIAHIGVFANLKRMFRGIFPSSLQKLITVDIQVQLQF